MSTSLPEVHSPQVQRIADEDPNYLSAYNICLKYEKEFAAFKDKLRSVRILGFLLLHAPSRGVRSEVTKCIHSRQDSSNLTGVGAFFERYVILPFKKHRGRTPKPSEHSSRPSFEAVKEEVKVNIAQAPRNHKDAKVHEIIGDFDWSSIVAVNTKCAHIIPEATFFGVDPESEDNAKLDYSASILAVLKRFRSDINKFNGEKVHSLTNVMSMESNVHDAFDRLELYFEATSGEENHYEVKWFGPRLPNVRRFVTFSTSDPEKLPVPAPDAAEYIDEIYHDADEMGVLSADGASGDVLTYMLLSLSQPVRHHHYPPAGGIAAGHLGRESDEGVY